MTRTIRVRYETLLRVRDFGTAHRALFPESSPAGQAFAAVAQAAAEIDQHATAKILVVKEGREATAATRRVILKRMAAVARTARGLRKTEARSGQKLLMPGRTSDVALIATANAFLQEAEPNAEQLRLLGLPATCLTELREALTAFTEALGERRAGRRRTAGATTGIDAALTRGFEALRTLDIIVPNTVENDPVISAQWERDRRVVGGTKKATPVTTEIATPAETTVEPVRRVS
jgi:hypothetical protein